MVPASLSGRPEADTARAMAQALADQALADQAFADQPFADTEAASTTDVFNRLRQSFPLAPLSERVAALSVIMGRLRHPF